MGKFILRADFGPGRHRIWWDSCDWLEGRLTIRLGRPLHALQGGDETARPWAVVQQATRGRTAKAQVPSDCELRTHLPVVWKTCPQDSCPAVGQPVHPQQLSGYASNAGPDETTHANQPTTHQADPQSLQPLPHNKDTNQCHAKNEVKLQESIKLQTGILRFTA